MRRPSTGQNEGDLNRLTTSASSQSNESLNSTQTIINKTNIDINNDNNNNNNNNNNSSTYLPNILVPNAEWQQCRKRKERQDSTSSITQDRKLVRSNSEEHVPNCQEEVIRRVSSHEDFKKRNPLQNHNTNGNTIKSSDLKGSQASIREECNQQAANEELINSKVINLIDIPTSASVANKSHRLSPNRDTRNQHHHHHSHRNKNINNEELNDSGEHERRRNSERFLKTRIPSGRKSPRKVSKKAATKYLERDENNSLSSSKSGRGFVSSEEKNELSGEEKKIIHPWDNNFTEDTPVVCQRFAENTFDHVHHSITKYIKSDHDLLKSHLDDGIGVVDDKIQQKPFRTFMNAENVKTRDLMQKSHGATGTFMTPDERIKQINKRLTSLKKKVAIYEENFETNYGYRPSQADKSNDRCIKNYIAEIHRLRKEKTQIKADPISAMGYKSAGSAGSITSETNLDKVKDALQDIEKRLHTKRFEEERELILDDMSSDQLVDEKTAVQRALLYFESLFGRPGTREERDAARPLYDRYRLLKRLVNRNNSVCGIAELPTILENEALAFPEMVTPSTDFSPPSATSAVQSPSDTSTSTSMDANISSSSSTSFQENLKLHSMSVEELYAHFDTIREEKKQLRRKIKEFEHNFEALNGRKMLKIDRCNIEEIYALYKQKKAKLRLLEALVKKQITN